MKKIFLILALALSSLSLLSQTYKYDSVILIDKLEQTSAGAGIKGYIEFYYRDAKEYIKVSIGKADLTYFLDTPVTRTNYDTSYVIGQPAFSQDDGIWITITCRFDHNRLHSVGFHQGFSLIIFYISAIKPDDPSTTAHED